MDKPEVKSGSTIRLFVEDELASGHEISLSSSQAHYVTNVMRRGVGDFVSLINGRDGEWTGRVQSAGRGRCIVTVER